MSEILKKVIYFRNSKKSLNIKINLNYNIGKDYWNP